MPAFWRRMTRKEDPSVYEDKDSHLRVCSLSRTSWRWAWGPSCRRRFLLCPGSWPPTMPARLLRYPACWRRW